MAGVPEAQVTSFFFLHGPSNKYHKQCPLSSSGVGSRAIIEADLSLYYQIRRAGRWNMGDSMTGCYLTSLPYGFMRALADFSPEWSGSYFIPRSTVLPSAWLRSQVWPNADFWLDALKDPAHEMAHVFDNRATGAFIELLGWLRVVLLQDAAFLIRDFPEHPVFQDPVFHSEGFKEFATRVLRASEESREDSQSELLQNAMPAVAEKVRGVEAGVQGLKKTVETEISSLKAEIRLLKDEIHERNKAEIHGNHEDQPIWEDTSADRSI